MDKKIIIFGNIDVEKHKFNQYKNPIRYTILTLIE